jgi:hypothetical protein
VKAKEEEKTNDKAKDKEDVKGRKRKRVTVSQMMTGKINQLLLHLGRRNKASQILFKK